MSTMISIRIISIALPGRNPRQAIAHPSCLQSQLAVPCHSGNVGNPYDPPRQIQKVCQVGTWEQPPPLELGTWLTRRKSCSDGQGSDGYLGMVNFDPQPNIDPLVFHHTDAQEIFKTTLVSLNDAWAACHVPPTVHFCDRNAACPWHRPRAALAACSAAFLRPATAFADP